MTQNRKEKKLARELQQRTGWSYTRALYMIREKTPEQREAAVTERVRQLAGRLPEARIDDITAEEDARILAALEEEANP